MKIIIDNSIAIFISPLKSVDAIFLENRSIKADMMIVEVNTMLEIE
jgi:hypothetical protein